MLWSFFVCSCFWIYIIVLLGRLILCSLRLLDLLYNTFISIFYFTYFIYLPYYRILYLLECRKTEYIIFWGSLVAELFVILWLLIDRALMTGDWLTDFFRENYIWDSSDHWETVPQTEWKKIGSSWFKSKYGMGYLEMEINSEELCAILLLQFSLEFEWIVPWFSNERKEVVSGSFL